MRFVVVEIPDDQDALDFIRAVTKGHLWYGKVVESPAALESAGEIEYHQIEGWKVPQVYAVPTKFCECPETNREGKSKKYGWYVCVKCAKPRKGSMQHPFNLMETGKTGPDRAYYMGFRADRRPWRIPKEG